MNRISAMLPGGFENAVDPQVAFAGGSRAQALGFVRDPDVQGGAIRVGVDRDAADSHLAKGANYSHCDLAPVSDQNLSEHDDRLYRERSPASFPYFVSTGLVELWSSPLYMAVASTQGSLKQRGVRLTRQRQILLDLIDGTGLHLDAERLYQMAKEKDPKLNRVTVYRTLKVLKETGLVDELDLMHYGGDQHYYETRLKQEHAHVICLRCGKVEEFFGDTLQRLRKQIEGHFGFQVLLARTEVGGYCAHCQTLRSREVEELRHHAEEPVKPRRKAGRGAS